MHALSELIQQCRAADPSLTYGRIAELTGGIVSETLVHRWGQEKSSPLKNFPDPKNLLALAKALRRSPAEVVIAAAKATGIDMRDSAASQFARRLPPGIDNLPEDVMEDLQRLIWNIYDKLVEQVNSPGATK